MHLFVVIRMNVFDIAGLSGFCLYVGVYASLQMGRIDGNSISYTFVNASAASLVLISLLQNFNLASALIQIMWISISVIGIIRIIVSRRNARKTFYHLLAVHPEVRRKKRTRVRKRRRFRKIQRIA